MSDTAEVVQLESRADWRDWLERNHETAVGVWLVTWKKPTGKPRVDYDAAVEEALCFGWIDGWFKPIDDDRGVIRYTPRLKGSNWSKYNIATAWNLLNENKMTPAGVAKLPKDVLVVWEKYRPRATVVVRVTQGRGIIFADGKNYLSMIKMPARAPVKNDTSAN